MHKMASIERQLYPELEYDITQYTKYDMQGEEKQINDLSNTTWDFIGSNFNCIMQIDHSLIILYLK